MGITTGGDQSRPTIHELSMYMYIIIYILCFLCYNIYRVQAVFIVTGIETVSDGVFAGIFVPLLIVVVLITAGFWLKR